MKIVKFGSFCPQYGNAKLVFLTEEEAIEQIRIKNHILFKDKGFIYTFPYYCEYCEGWHLTSTSYHRLILEMMNHIRTIPTKFISVDIDKEALIQLKIYELEWKIADKIGNFETLLKILKRTEKLAFTEEEITNQRRNIIKKKFNQMKGWTMTKILSDIPDEVTFANEFQNLMYYYYKKFDSEDLKQCYIICQSVLCYLEDTTLDIGDKEIYRRKLQYRLLELREEIENFINYFMELNDIPRDTEDRREGLQTD